MYPYLPKAGVSCTTVSLAISRLTLIDTISKASRNVLTRTTTDPALTIALLPRTTHTRGPFIKPRHDSETSVIRLQEDASELLYFTLRDTSVAKLYETWRE